MVTFVGTTPPTYYGLTTDEKPTQYVQNGSVFIEMDASALYFYDAETETWQEWGGESDGV